MHNGNESPKDGHIPKLGNDVYIKLQILVLLVSTPQPQFNEQKNHVMMKHIFSKELQITGTITGSYNSLNLTHTCMHTHLRRCMHIFGLSSEYTATCALITLP
jgi:hypothetical protein